MAAFARPGIGLLHGVARLVPQRSMQLAAGSLKTSDFRRGTGLRDLAALVQLGLQASGLIVRHISGNAGRTVALHPAAGGRLRCGAGRKAQGGGGNSGDRQPSPNPEQSLHLLNSCHLGFHVPTGPGSAHRGTTRNPLDFLLLLPPIFLALGKPPGTKVKPNLHRAVGSPDG
jgi:hypothetical protein